MVAHRQPIEERIVRYSMPPTPSGCMIWLAQIDEDGYGRIWQDGRKRGAHVVAWELANGCQMPEGLVIDHLCKIPYCVAPAHLEAVTVKVNTNRGMASVVNPGQKKFFCDDCGGPYELVSTRRDGRVDYGCRACRLTKHRRWRGSVSRAEYLVKVRGEH